MQCGKSFFVAILNDKLMKLNTDIQPVIFFGVSVIFHLLAATGSVCMSFHGKKCIR
jgi:hypothetical protein